MAYSEVTGGGTINGTAFTKGQTSELQADWSGGGGDTTATTAQVIKAGTLVRVNITAYTSGTIQAQTAPIGTTTWSPHYVDGSYDITAKKAFDVFCSQTCLFRLIPTVAAVASATIQKS